MKCPACDRTLVEIKAGDVLVDVCNKGCGGVWFDEFELKRFDEPHEFEVEAIFGATEGAKARPTEKTVRDCPKCQGEILWKRWYDLERAVEVDQCPKCSGIWLDIGELQSVRSQYETEEERQNAAESYLGTQLAATKDEFEARASELRAEARAMANSRLGSFRNAMNELLWKK